MYVTGRKCVFLSWAMNIPDFQPLYSPWRSIEIFLLQQMRRSRTIQQVLHLDLSRENKSKGQTFSIRSQSLIGKFSLYLYWLSSIRLVFLDGYSSAIVCQSCLCCFCTRRPHIHLWVDQPSGFSKQFRGYFVSKGRLSNASLYGQAWFISAYRIANS